MMKEQERRLFQRWQEERGYKPFVKDGVFDETTWSAEPMKITFVLKDANWRYEDVDLCEWVLENKPWKTWNNIARWTKALLEGGEYPRYIPMEERNRLLSRVSFLNLKKAGGESKAKPEEVREAARKDAAYIREQLLLYKPDLIVCCGSFRKWSVADILKKDVLLREGSTLFPQDEEEMDGVHLTYICFPGKERLTPVVSFCHPEKRYSGHEEWQEWYGQMKTVREMLPPPEL